MTEIKLSSATIDYEIDGTGPARKRTLGSRLKIARVPGRPRP
jgi:hypothetical protein|tara:strand:+ start:1024 stop:1149 length:126 start_codon:yes stop_codon:yes gene_type:complete